MDRNDKFDSISIYKIEDTGCTSNRTGMTLWGLLKEKYQRFENSKAGEILIPAIKKGCANGVCTACDEIKKAIQKGHDSDKDS